MLSVMLHGMITVLATAGLAVASYLAYGNVGDTSLYCELGHGCDAVQDSGYSMVLGVPVAVGGVLLYAGILAAAVSSLLFPRPSREMAHAILGMGLAGTIYSGYLAWVELYRIEAVCMWCTASAVIVTAIFVLSGFNLALGTRGALDDDISEGEV